MSRDVTIVVRSRFWFELSNPIYERRWAVCSGRWANCQEPMFVMRPRGMVGGGPVDPPAKTAFAPGNYPGPVTAAGWKANYPTAGDVS